MKELNFSTGKQEYKINEATVYFNPTDVFFASRIADLFDKMDGLQQKYKGQVEASNGGADTWRICRTIDSEMRKAVNDIFEADVADGIFGGVACYAVSEGLPVWANLALALMDEMDDSIVTEQKKTNPRLQHYLDKYAKKDTENA